MMKSISCILLVCLFRRIAYAEETQEQQVERLIKELQDTDPEVRGSAADALGSIGGCRRSGAGLSQRWLLRP